MDARSSDCMDLSSQSECCFVSRKGRGVPYGGTGKFRSPPHRRVPPISLVERYSEPLSELVHVQAITWIVGTVCACA